jgi:acyl carrier protein
MPKTTFERVALVITKVIKKGLTEIREETTITDLDLDVDQIDLILEGLAEEFAEETVDVPSEAFSECGNIGDVIVFIEGQLGQTPVVAEAYEPKGTGGT